MLETSSINIHLLPPVFFLFPAVEWEFVIYFRTADLSLRIDLRMPPANWGKAINNLPYFIDIYYSLTGQHFTTLVKFICCLKPHAGFLIPMPINCILGCFFLKDQKKKRITQYMGVDLSKLTFQNWRYRKFNSGS